MTSTRIAAATAKRGGWSPVIYEADGPDTLTGLYPTEAEAVAAAEQQIAADADPGTSAGGFVWDGEDLDDLDFEDAF